MGDLISTSNVITDKKGQLTDVLVWMITIFILAIGLFIFIYIIPSITNGLEIAGLNNTQEGQDAINSLETFGTVYLNNGFLMLFAGLIMGVMISSFLVRTHPIFLFLYIILLGITILIGFYLGNAYEQMIQNPIFSNMIDQASFINLVMRHIAEITMVVGGLSMIIVFAKFSTGGTSQQF